MKTSLYYKLALPEMEDPADVRDLSDNFTAIDAELQRQKEEDERQAAEDAAIRAALTAHKSAKTLDHPDASVTDAKLGPRSIGGLTGALQALLTAIGDAIKAVTGGGAWNDPPATTLKAAKTHADDTVRHLTAAERARWNDTYTKAETDAKGKTVADALAAHADDAEKHVTAQEHADLASLVELLAVIDCGGFTGEAVSAVALHNATARAHPLLALDGNITDGGADVATLQEHMTDTNAHANLIVDGNITE